MVERNRRRAARRRLEKRRRLMFLLCILLVFPILLKGIQIKNRILHIRPENVRYVEFIKYPENKMVTVEDRETIGRILKKINKFSGTYVGSDAATDKEVSFLNIYTRRDGKVELTKTDEYIGVNGRWYKVRPGNIRDFDGFFKDIFKD